MISNYSRIQTLKTSNYINFSQFFNISTKKFKAQNKHLLNIVNKIEFLEQYYIDFKYNITLEERNAICELKNTEQIIMKPSYKGGGLIVMDSSYYEHERIVKEQINK